MMETKNYYEVIAKCGHVGKKHYVPVKFAVIAEDGKEAAKMVGEMVAKKAVEKGITEVVFDRGGYIYHGRIKELAEGAREAGLKF